MAQLIRAPAFRRASVVKVVSLDLAAADCLA